MPPESPARAIIEHTGRHLRAIGPPGSGKTRLLVERFRALEARGRRPGIVAFGHEQRQRLVELVIPPNTGRLGPEPVTTHALLASAILNAANPSRLRTLRDVDELLVLGRLLRREPSLLASDLSAIAASSTFLRDLLEAVHALAQHGLAPDAARTCADSGAGPRARDVLHAYARYREVCGERGLVTFYDAAWRAAERFDAGGISSPLAGFDVVLIDDFHDLDPGQYRLLTRLVPPQGATALEAFGDPTGARFAFRGTTDRFFTTSFPRDYAPVDFELNTPRTTDAALAATVHSLVAETSRAERPTAAAADLPLFQNLQDARASGALNVRPPWACTATLVIADDEIAEAQAVATRARAALDAGVAPRDIAVIARNPARYRSALLIAYHEWGVPLDPGGEGHGAAADFLRSLFGALGADADARFADALAASPFTPRFCEGYGDVTGLVRALKREYAPRGGGFDLERLVRERVTPALPRGDTASHAALAAVIEEWQRYAEVVDNAGGGASLDEFRAAYLGEPLHRPASVGRVALLSPREATGRSFHTVFVCGCAEGHFPAAAVRDGYIPVTALARALEKVDTDAAADIVARVDEAAVERAENALFLTALTRAREALTILAPARIAGESTVPARVLGPEEGFTRETASRATSPCARAAAAVAASPPSPELAERLRALDPLAGWWASPAPPERLPALESFSMSASKLSSYARCPRQFFYRKVLKLDEPESIYLRVGNLVHKALNEIIPAGSSGDEVRAALRGAGTREISERLVSEAMKDAGPWMRDLSVRYLEDMLVSVAELEAQREGSYRVRFMEESVKAEVEGMPLSGKIDRMDDVTGLGSVIIDYKTSGNIARTHPTLVDKIETDYWQIPVYTTLAAVNGVGAAGFVYYALPPGDESFAVGVQLAPGHHPAPIPLGSRRPYRYGPVDTGTVAGAMARAVEIHRSILEGGCRYERTPNLGICPNCHFARICQRSQASI